MICQRERSMTRQIAGHALHMMAALRGGYEIEFVRGLPSPGTYWKVPHSLIGEVGNMVVRVA